MHQRFGRIATAMLASATLAVLVSGPAAGAARVPVPPQPALGASPADIAPALSPDGVFRGAPGVRGTVDTHAWTLVSNLSSGEAPRFAPASAVPAPAAAGDVWSAVGPNGTGAPTGGVAAIAVSGSNIYIGGAFVNADGIPQADFLVKWNGTAWSALGSSSDGTNGALNSGVNAFAFIGSDLYVGGSFTDAAGIPEADFITKWSGSTWSALGSDGAGNGALRQGTPGKGGYVRALAVAGIDLYVGGDFWEAGTDIAAGNVAKWDGSTWSALGNNGSGGPALAVYPVFALAFVGSDLYVGGQFTDVMNDPMMAYLARWDGSSWSAVGSNGSSGPAINTIVYTLAVNGSNLYVGGAFTNAGGIAEADHVAKWSGSAWSALGSNGAGDGALGGDAYGLAVSGADIYVAGEFTNAAGIPEADYVALWDGVTWSALGSNGTGDGALNAYAHGIAQDGTSVYVGGIFQNAAGVATADYLAAWGPAPAFVAIHRPDGRIRLGTGIYAGDNIYNATGAGQGRTGYAKRGVVIAFGISIQNDGNVADAFRVKATGAATTRYTVKYYRGSTDITAKVLAGTYRTTSLAPGAAYVITAKVTVRWTATIGSSVTRLVAVTSVGETAKKDVVKLVGKRK